MLNRKKLALILAAVLTVSLFSVSAAVPDEDAASAGQSPAAQGASVGRMDIFLAGEESGKETSAAETADGGETAAQPEAEEPEPDAEGTLSFANLEQRVRAGSLDLLYLEETIAQIEAIDYEELKEDMRDGLNELADAQWGMLTMGSMFQTGNPALDPVLQGIASLSTSSASQSLDAQYDALREQYDDLKDGKIQADAADQVRQLRHTQNNIVMLAEAAYIQLLEAGAGAATLDRSLEALDRQIQELELRYELGQISALTLQKAKAGRTTLASTRQTLDMSMGTGLMNLESLVGAPLTGTLRLSGLPEVTKEELKSMDVEADLAAAMEISYDLYAAKQTLDDAEETFKDAGKEYHYNTKNYEYVQAQHAWQAAQYSYEGTLRGFELSFRNLYAQVKDYEQVLAAARTSLAVEQENYSVAQLKHEQGAISQNALLTAWDEVCAAQDTVDTAARNLFSAYNNYRWAVDFGILN